MIICKDGCYAYSGATAAEAFSAYMNADDDHNKPNAKVSRSAPLHGAASAGTQG